MLLHRIKMLFSSEDKIIKVAALMWLMIAILFWMNDRYTVKVDSKTYLLNVNEHQYGMFISRVPNAFAFVKGTTVRYFGIFPDWILNIFYPGFFLLILWFMSWKISQEEKTKRKKLLTPEQVKKEILGLQEVLRKQFNS